MKHTAILILLAGASSAVLAASMQSAAFTYQGRLYSSGDLADGSYTMTFKAYDSSTLGTQIGPTLTKSPVTVSKGYFQTTLDFGPELPRGVRVWLEITVKKYNTSETAVTLSPRQEVTPAANAVYAQKAGELAPEPAMINHVVRLYIPGQGTYYFHQITGLGFYNEVVVYSDPQGQPLYYVPGRAVTQDFTLVRYATADSSLWNTRNQVSLATCDLYIINMRNSVIVDSYKIYDGFVSGVTLESDEQGEYVLEKVRFSGILKLMNTTGGTMSWQLPPPATVVVPVTITIAPSRQETFGHFSAGWEYEVIREIVDDVPHLRPGIIKDHFPTFRRASTGNGFIADWYLGILNESVIRKTITVPLYNSVGTLVFTLQMPNAWPCDIEKSFSGQRDCMLETITFAPDTTTW